MRRIPFAMNISKELKNIIVFTAFNKTVQVILYSQNWIGITAAHLVMHKNCILMHTDPLRKQI